MDRVIIGIQSQSSAVSLAHRLATAVGHQ